MLRYSFGLNELAGKIENAVRKAVKDNCRTGDIAFGKSPITTSEMAQAIIERV